MSESTSFFGRAWLGLFLGACVVAVSWTWGAYQHWVWPIGAALIILSLLVAWMKRSPKALYVLSALILIGLSVLRGVWLDQTVERTYEMSWQVDALKTNTINMRFVDFPTYVERIQSKALLDHLSDTYANKTVPVTFDVLYDFNAPKRQRMSKVGEQPVQTTQAQGTLWIEAQTGGRVSDSGANLVSPWDKQ